MSNRPVIYHNTRCSKSRATLALLEQHDLDPVVIDYQKSPPEKSELRKILTLLACTPRDLMRSGQSEYRDNNLDDPELDEDQLINAMINHPILIERPIVVYNDKAVVGRPPENVLKII